MKDDKDEVSSLLSTTKLLSTVSEDMVQDPYEDFDETQSDLSSRYSNDKGLQSLRLPVVNVSPPNETIIAAVEEPITPCSIDEISSIPQPLVTCIFPTPTLTSHVSPFKHTVPCCDIDSHNTVLSVTSLQSGAPVATSCASVQCHIVRQDDTQENL